MLAGNGNRWRIASWVLLMLLASVIFLGAHAQSDRPARTVEAQEFILKDSSGRVRAKLGMKDDQSTIELYEEQGSTVWNVPSKGFKPVQGH